MLVQYLEARNKGRVVGGGGRDSRQGLDVAYLSALATSAKLVEEESRIRNHFVSQTMTLKVCLCCHLPKLMYNRDSVLISLR